MPTWLAAVIALGALAATYFLCWRPMVRGRGRCGLAASDRDREIAALRQELRDLRTETMPDGRAVDPLDR
ncbi:hypothetical protein ABZ215_23945 [Amycolatopsis sp. NPDC006131]|uniref:hypothetical protein n=1 Tax=Amycolatopsis sp. NPDC006131 TaxID=3156731 RepID=UPI0033B81B99